MVESSPRGWTSGRDSAVASFETNSYGTITVSIGALARNPSIAHISKNDPNYHEYSASYSTGIKATDAPLSRVEAALKAQPTPFTHEFAGPGFVFDGAPPASSAVVNVTQQNWHFLDPGVVQRTLGLVNGSYNVSSVGIGVGIAKTWNVALADVVWDAAGALMEDPNKKVIDDYLDGLDPGLHYRAADLPGERDRAKAQVREAHEEGYGDREIADSIASKAPGGLSYLASGRDRRDNPYGPNSSTPRFGGTSPADMVKAVQSSPGYRPSSSPDVFHSQNPADRQLTQPGANTAPHVDNPTSRPSGGSSAATSARTGNDPTGRGSSNYSGGSNRGDTARRGNDPTGPSRSEPSRSGASHSSSGPSSSRGESARRGNDPTGPSRSESSHAGSSHSSGGGSRSGGGGGGGSQRSGPPGNQHDNGRRPILLDLDGNGLKLTELSRSSVFMDTQDDGLLHRTAWAGAGDGVLFFDANGDGQITETREYVFTEWDPTATGDLEALRAAFDGNGDGRLTAADAAFAKFRVMVTNADGSLTARTLTDLGITEINLKGDATEIVMPDGSRITGEATFRTASGTVGVVADAVLESEADGSRVVQSVSTDASGSRVVVSRSYDGGGEIAHAITSVTSRDGNTLASAVVKRVTGCKSPRRPVRWSAGGRGLAA